ncbi:hypothetical protein QJS10_CPA10g00898 [Acorus calamus]|uniref:Uncharacterized protein n=1 Tax=Acorus calamus TaxID=4465 RepID=A0AAV9DX95_ACOCL|nr:hypothetical protein QJS10_CPA10g00898 [Acorus calamus]
MASTCIRSITRAAVSTVRSSIRSNARPPSLAPSPPSGVPLRTSPIRRFPSFTRSVDPAVLGVMASLMPLHSAVADARLTSCLSSASSRSCRALSQDGTDGT